MNPQNAIEDLTVILGRSARGGRFRQVRFEFLPLGVSQIATMRCHKRNGGEFSGIRVPYFRRRLTPDLEAMMTLQIRPKQCLDRRIPDIETLKTEVAAWESQRNETETMNLAGYDFILEALFYVASH